VPFAQICRTRCAQAMSFISCKHGWQAARWETGISQRRQHCILRLQFCAFAILAILYLPLPDGAWSQFGSVCSLPLLAINLRVEVIGNVLHKAGSHFPRHWNACVSTDYIKTCADCSFSCCPPSRLRTSALNIPAVL